ncbi:hypothetical protein LM599_06825 [Candidatus Acetothermia bacterium]|jgi:hypothetical protein|nr:hypothetical protein [Candidatus Acetothermia bacterium]MCI2427501.1 hypothetical protein [Candidatus Acetothermia bacterium]MCI2428003.1 hypothetical protein [Candidatus Acetothermia bacterium]
MSQQELLKKVIQVLDRAEIQYMLTGSVVSSLQGEPRSTHDIDIVVAIQNSRIHELLVGFPPPDFYLDKNSILDAINRQRMFNLIDLKGGGKVDFWILTDEPFDQSRFSRRYSEEFMGVKMQVSSPEDTILAKLRWAKLSGGSEKQSTDALRIYEVQYGQLDIDYLKAWAKKLGVESLWKWLTDVAEIV